MMENDGFLYVFCYTNVWAVLNSFAPQRKPIESCEFRCPSAETARRQKSSARWQWNLSGRRSEGRCRGRRSLAIWWGTSLGFSGHHGEFNGRCNGNHMGIIWENGWKWDIMGITKLLKFTPPHKCHTTTVLYVYFGSSVKLKQLCCLLCIFSESGSGALAPVKGSLGKWYQWLPRKSS